MLLLIVTLLVFMPISLVVIKIIAASNYRFAFLPPREWGFRKGDDNLLLMGANNVCVKETYARTTTFGFFKVGVYKSHENMEGPF